VVTGGGGGLGELIVRAVAERGWVPVVVDADGEAAARVAGSSGAAVTADLRDPDVLPAVVSGAVALGRLGSWINCAGAWSPSQQFPNGDDWRDTLALDLESPMLATQLCLEPMRSAGGAVVNVASSAGLGDAAYDSPEYAAAKAGLIRFTTSVAGLAESHGVRVSCVVPHWIGLARAYDEWASLSAEEREASGGLVPAGEVVDAVLSLADDPNSAGRVVALRGRPVV